MLQQFFGIPNVIGVYWTLQIELIFYGICALLFSLKIIEKPSTAVYGQFIFLLGALVLAFLRYRLDRAFPVALFLSLAVMFLGNSCYWILEEAWAPKSNIAGLLLAWLVALVPVCMMAYSKDRGHSESVLQYVLDYAIGISMAIFLSAIRRIEWRLLGYLGAISYSLYLFHPLVAFVMFSSEVKAEDPLIIVEAIVVSFVVASVAYFLIERPFQDVGKWVRGHLDGKSVGR